MSKTAAKTLIAAAIAATAVPAFAQGVILYGIADVGVAITNFDGQTLSQVRENRTARWGMRGAEQLGGGLEMKTPPSGGVFAAVGGWYKVRTCDPCRVKAVLYR